MADRLATAMPVEGAIEFRGMQLVERREERLHSACAVPGKLAGHAVELASIASGKNEGLLENSARPEQVRSFASLLRAKRAALAQVHWRRAVVQSDEDDFHLRDDYPFRLLAFRPTSEIPVEMRQIPVHDAVTENHK